MNGSRDGQEVAVHIGELVVDGGRGVEAVGLAAALESELGRLVAASGVEPAAATHARLDGGAIAPGFGGRDDSAAVGRRVAEAVHHALGGGR